MNEIQQRELIEKELKHRLDAYDHMHKFLTEFASWDKTTDSWYNLFKGYQKRAEILLENIKP